jgi:hypothetical protein
MEMQAKFSKKPFFRPNAPSWIPGQGHVVIGPTPAQALKAPTIQMRGMLPQTKFY